MEYQDNIRTVQGMYAVVYSGENRLLGYYYTEVLETDPYGMPLSYYNYDCQTYENLDQMRKGHADMVKKWSSVPYPKREPIKNLVIPDDVLRSWE